MLFCSDFRNSILFACITWLFLFFCSFVLYLHHYWLPLIAPNWYFKNRATTTSYYVLEVFICYFHAQLIIRLLNSFIGIRLLNFEAYASPCLRKRARYLKKAFYNIGQLILRFPFWFLIGYNMVIIVRFFIISWRWTLVFFNYYFFQFLRRIFV